MWRLPFILNEVEDWGGRTLERKFQVIAFR
jgi:hypothetical protein